MICSVGVCAHVQGVCVVFIVCVCVCVYKNSIQVIVCVMRYASISMHTHLCGGVAGSVLCVATRH